MVGSIRISLSDALAKGMKLDDIEIVSDDDDISCCSTESDTVSDEDCNDFSDSFDSEDDDGDEDSVVTTRSQAFERLSQTCIQAEAMLRLEMERLGLHEGKPALIAFPRRFSAPECLVNTGKSEGQVGIAA
ncbi:expressed unknown protein [Seminavis robusta]|uniref:Uncharacterized protein n=1 Tax=Seminavis robusta TaxID=568900 RepID=A0A9N8EUS2_9STRA|nr:expressed unknown protein [Seminavis robusta]|eukprot:Sro1881_g303350.1 n/a (131) ;mRNA; r:17063-17455